MGAACSVLAVVMLVLVLGACGGESSEEKAQTPPAMGRDDIGKRVAELKSLTPTTVTTDAVTQNLDAIKTDLKDISDAQSDLSSDRRSEVEAANKAFTSSVQGIGGEVGSSLSASAGRPASSAYAIADGIANAATVTPARTSRRAVGIR